ncbi:MAG: peptide chain release factor 1 [Candidatus Nealsonbacteria bacterium]|nr:MAG: peptide chain release factor 1 [Candidatus Nealsonbacteria bacterium]
MANLENAKKEYDEILKQLADPELLSDYEKLEELSKKKAHLEKIINKSEELKEVKDEIEENKEIIKTKEDPELSSLAETELSQLQDKEKILEKELESLLKNEAPKASQSAIMEIRAGTGGEEASLFAANLYRMYSKYAQSQGWRLKVLSSHATELGGFKEIIFEIKNGDVYSKIQHEGGVHRVQRIPATEKSGRIHTSTASVAVLPKPKKATARIRPDELKIDTYRASGPGGQYVNRRESAIRITHLPTGLVVTSQTERSQLQNKENAMAILEAKLHELKEIEQLEKMGEKRKAQIKRAQRADKIRTYNFPQDRVTDHRIQKSFHNIESIMDGNLNPIIESLAKNLEKKE